MNYDVCNVYYVQYCVFNVLSVTFCCKTSFPQGKVKHKESFVQWKGSVDAKGSFWNHRC